jgi:hypothetical protein
VAVHREVHVLHVDQVQQYAGILVERGGHFLDDFLGCQHGIGRSCADLARERVDLAHRVVIAVGDLRALVAKAGGTVDQLLLAVPQLLADAGARLRRRSDRCTCGSRTGLIGRPALRRWHIAALRQHGYFGNPHLADGIDFRLRGNLETREQEGMFGPGQFEIDEMTDAQFVDPQFDLRLVFVGHDQPICIKTSGSEHWFVRQQPQDALIHC